MKNNTKIYNKFEGYTLEDCNCKYCLYFGGRRRGKVKCLAEECVCKEEINYTEAVFFGLSLRQIIFSACALAVAVAVFFLLKPTLGTETTSWICILAAAPFAALGFVKYNGMTAEKFVIAWVKSEFLTPKKLTFKSTNTYYELMKPVIEQKEKEAMKAND